MYLSMCHFCYTIKHPKYFFCHWRKKTRHSLLDKVESEVGGSLNKPDGICGPDLPNNKWFGLKYFPCLALGRCILVSLSLTRFPTSKRAVWTSEKVLIFNSDTGAAESYFCCNKRAFIIYIGLCPSYIGSCFKRFFKNVTKDYKNWIPYSTFWPYALIKNILLHSK